MGDLGSGLRKQHVNRTEFADRIPNWGQIGVSHRPAYPQCQVDAPKWHSDRLLKRDAANIEIGYRFDEGFLMRVPALQCVQAREGPALENLPRTKARASW